ncbi:ricin-type beta-trefoil lectin domain protein [Paenibacillus silvae]|uniref:Ricin-type beta-trefoil lectin domain protein n=2 Tax=Paenibacillus silvae TaxID=1325358 RepID=A0A2W6NA85_9BACL|nr:ricin-type beta-trefoil lectin domain protein [Paenibacillus silvae]
MYATFEQTSNTTPVFPIYESVNNGETWTKVGEVQDTQNGWGMLNCPELFELPQSIGNMPAGTLLLAGNSVPGDKSATKMELYKSNDLGRTWTYVSTIAEGGRNDIGYDPIWEPFFLVHNNKLIVYYSDERDAAHAQKLVHQVSTDGVNWGSVVEDVALSDSNLRPGMPTIAKMGNGSFAMTYEMVGYSGIPNYIKISPDPENWNPTEIGTVVGYGGSPYIAALSDGRLALNIASKKEILINSSRVDASGSWVPYNPPVNSGYNRQLLPLSNGRLFIPQAGFFSGKNTVSYGDMSVGYYKLVNVKSGKPLSVAGGGTANGDQLIQWSSESNSLDQYWLISSVENGYAPNGYKHLVNAKSGKVAGIYGASASEGARAVIWGENKSDDQQWTLQASGSYFKIVNRNSGKVLGLSQGSTADGAQVIQQADVGSTDQQWQLVADEGHHMTDSYRLTNVNSGKVLGIYSGSIADGGTAVQWLSGQASYDQNWLIVSTADGYIKLVNTNSNKNLGILEGSDADGAQAVQWNDNGSNDQQWTLEASGDHYKIVNRNSNKVLGVEQGSTIDGAKIVQMNDTGSADQLWHIVKNK